MCMQDYNLHRNNMRIKSSRNNGINKYDIKK